MDYTTVVLLLLCSSRPNFAFKPHSLTSRSTQPLNDNCDTQCERDIDGFCNNLNTTIHKKIIPNDHDDIAVEKDHLTDSTYIAKPIRGGYSRTTSDSDNDENSEFSRLSPPRLSDVESNPKRKSRFSSFTIGSFSRRTSKDLSQRVRNNETFLNNGHLFIPSVTDSFDG